MRQQDTFTLTLTEDELSQVRDWATQAVIDQRDHIDKVLRRHGQDMVEAGERNLARKESILRKAKEAKP